MRGDLDDLKAFAAVARAQSFTRAAAELGVSTSALSYTIRRLETRLGIRLLQRTSRSVAASEAGSRLLRTLDPALAQIDEALDDLKRDQGSVSGTLRITATREAYESVVHPVLARFCAAYPDATLEVMIDYGFRDIVADRFDAGIRLGEKLEQDMIALKVGPDLRMAVVAAPAYLERHGTPLAPQDLTGHRCINYRMMASGTLYAWEFERDGRKLEIRGSGPLTFNEPQPMRDAAIEGLGVAYLLEHEVTTAIAAGRLVRLFEQWTPVFPGFFLYYASRRQMPTVLAAFVDLLRQAHTAPAAGADR